MYKNQPKLFKSPSNVYQLTTFCMKQGTDNAVPPTNV